MNFILGAIIVIASVLGGYVAMHGKLSALNQPFELVIIGGAALGAFIISNQKHVLKRSLKAVGIAIKGSRHKKQDFLELLSMQYQVYKLARTKGMLALEQHVENPHESSIFSNYPHFVKEHHAVIFFCDYLRMITLGADKPHEIEALMDEELEVHHEDELALSHAFQTMSDGIPALGIVAAVLGVIKTMGAITEPPEVLGRLIGGALVGTFLGVFLSYGYIGPLANALKGVADSEARYYLCLKVGLLAHLSGCAPAISVEYARKALEPHLRPTFYEVEEAVNALPSVA
ncbi:MAG: flagellar motor stator protein MotA [Alphaproteobacteria bacterium]|nr:MAG: flagellar motor stator protein MotA [Alphaproteobacteria bacterium]